MCDYICPEDGAYLEFDDEFGYYECPNCGCATKNPVDDLCKPFGSDLARLENAGFHIMDGYAYADELTLADEHENIFFTHKNNREWEMSIYLPNGFALEFVKVEL